MDSSLWQLIAFCAGTGGSIFVIGSAAGVALMGLEKVDFLWYKFKCIKTIHTKCVNVIRFTCLIRYARKISLSALAGYLGGIAMYTLQQSIFPQTSSIVEMAVASMGISQISL